MGSLARQFDRRREVAKAENYKALGQRWQKIFLRPRRRAEVGSGTDAGMCGYFSEGKPPTQPKGEHFGENARLKKGCARRVCRGVSFDIIRAVHS
jgi:hypothetical protein